MMESSPATALIMSQPEFLFELFVIALDDPTVFDQPRQRGQSGLRRQSRQPVLGGFRFARGPFHQQPFFRIRFTPVMIPVGRADPNGRKTRFQFVPGSFPPGNGFPGVVWQRKRQFFYRDRLMLRIPMQPGGRAPPALPPWFRSRHFTGRPHGHVLVNADRIPQVQFGDPFPKSGLMAISGICQDRRS